MRILLPILAAVGALLVIAPASAKDTVECSSKNYKYTECYAESLEQPVLIYQSSDADCIMNRSWGYNPRKNYVWVSDGCSGVFSDSNGYHHGRTNTYDKDARIYNPSKQRISQIADLYNDDYDRTHNTSEDYDGCHGMGCLVDNPDD